MKAKGLQEFHRQQHRREDRQLQAGDTYRWFTMSRVIPFLDRPLDRFMAEVDRLLKREA